jgi:putative transposase
LANLVVCRSFQLLVLITRGEAAKDLELLVLRHQLTVLRRQIPRPKLEPADRALLAAVSRILPRSRWSWFFVRPETLLRWHRRLVAGAWTYPHRQTGRPPRHQDVQQLIIRLAKENPTWGYQRIKGELLRLGVQVSATAIRATLRRHGLDPAPRRAATSWRAFLRRQAAGVRCVRLLHGRHDLAAAAVCLVLHRTPDATGPHGWRDRRQPRRQVGYPAGSQPAAGVRRTRAEGAVPAARSGREVLSQLRRRVPIGGWRGGEVPMTPVRAPKANAYAERWVRTVRAECLDWLLVLGRVHLEQVLRVHAEHDNADRPHRALRLEPPLQQAGLTVVAEGQPARVHRRDLLGGLLHEYRRAA